MTGPPRRRRHAVAAAALGGALLALIASCSSSGNDTSARPRPRPTSTTVAEPTDAPQASPGCGRSHVGVLSRVRRTLDVAGTERWYLLSTPPAHDGRRPLPLVVEFHGLAEGAPVAANMSNFDHLGARKGFVTVFPNGSGQPVQWNSHVTSPGANPDLAFVSDLLATLGRDLCIDTSRVYATGLSDGAIMSSSLACAEADRFAAIAPVSGITFPPGCRPARRIPILAMHGTKDPILFFNGGVGDLAGALTGRSPQPPAAPPDLHGKGYPATVARWAHQNGCRDRPTDRRIRPHVIERSYPCPAGSPVEFLIIDGGGHSWPGSAFSAAIGKIVGPTTTEIDATAEIWAFLSRFSSSGPVPAARR